MSLESIVFQLRNLDTAIIDHETPTELRSRISTILDHIQGIHSTEDRFGAELEIIRSELSEMTTRNSKLSRENENLKAQIKAPEEGAKRVKDEQIKILEFIFQQGGKIPWDVIAHHFQLNRSEADYHIAQLFEFELLTQTDSEIAGFRPAMLGITQKGRALIMERRR